MSRHPRRRTRRQLSLQVLDDRRVLAAIVGSVFNDVDDSLHRDLDESGLAGRLVYVDQNDNARIDGGERYALTDASGGFSIDDMADGVYAVRLFNGTSSQIQTTPTSAESLHDTVLRDDVTTAVAARVLDAGTQTQRTAPAMLASGTQLQSVAADGMLGAALDLGGEIQGMTRLADGSLLVLGQTSGEGRIWTIDETGANSTEFSSPGNGLLLDSLASDDVGRGVAVASAVEGQSELWSIDAGDLSMTATGVFVPGGSVVTGDASPRTHDGPTRSVISHAELVDDGNGGMTQSLAVSFWSHADDSVLSDPIVVSGVSEVVAFHDEAGLIVLRVGDDLTVHDVDSANLATLYTIADTQGVAAIDGARGLIVTLSPRSFADAGSANEPGLRLIESETGSVVADLAIDLSALGDLAGVSLDGNLSQIVVTGAAGLSQLNLRRTVAGQARVDGGDSDPVIFGLRLLGSNSAPSYVVPPVINAIEDEALLRPAPGVALGSSDIDIGDEYVVLQSGNASVGRATVQPDGQILFIPPADFEGPATVGVILHDGRDSIETLVILNVVGVPDPPTGFDAVIDPVPENILPADLNGDFDAIGVINIIDVDLVNNFEFAILDENLVPDERFQVINGELVFVGPGRLDFENEWTIPLIMTVTDPDTDTTLEYATSITVTDADDPITDITPTSGVVQENSPGEIIKSIVAVDQDFDDIHSWSVDDDRFEVVSGELKLKADQSLDREAAETITINITASFGNDSFTKPFTLTVIDLPEVPANFLLTNATVMELEPAAVVGDLTIAGNPAVNGHLLTVNDSRFVFEGSTLRLADDFFLERTPGIDDEILIEVTATPDASGAAGVPQAFLINVVENDKPFHNDDNPEDVNGNGEVSSVDALVIINYLNTFGPGSVGEGDPALGYDVNNDGFVTSLDALLVINDLNASGNGGGGTVGNEPGSTPSGEPIEAAGEEIATDEVPVAPSQPPVAPSGRRISSREEAFAGLGDTLSSPERRAVVASPGDVFHGDVPASGSITSESMRDGDAEESTDEVFGESDLDLLG